MAVTFLASCGEYERQRSLPHQWNCLDIVNSRALRNVRLVDVSRGRLEDYC